MNTPSFVWYDRAGEAIKPEKMATRYMLNCLLLIWNYTAPEEYRIEPFRAVNDSRWSPRYRRSAVIAFCIELKKRQLSSEERDILNRIVEMARAAFPYDQEKLSLK